MARQEINLGTAPTGVGGDTTRTTGVKINAMTQELYPLALGAVEGKPLVQAQVTSPDAAIAKGRGAIFNYLGGGLPPGVPDGALLTMGYNSDVAYQLLGNWATGDLYAINKYPGQGYTYKKFYHTGNTTRAADGTLKAI